MRMLQKATLQDQAIAVMLDAQDSPSSRIMPGFIAVYEGNNMTSLTLTDRSV